MSTLTGPKQDWASWDQFIHNKFSVKTAMNSTAWKIPINYKNYKDYILVNQLIFISLTITPTGNLRQKQHSWIFHSAICVEIRVASMFLPTEWKQDWWWCQQVFFRLCIQSILIGEKRAYLTYKIFLHLKSHFALLKRILHYFWLECKQVWRQKQNCCLLF